ncbi:MAG TPA: hypothetical protein VFX70_20665 [Mycobacteriales bacterium]|nr:hypothetical protein [Mycobacteriales bacterium]
MTRDDDDGRSPDSGGSPVGGEPFDWQHFTVPDDMRELQADIRAYHREQRAHDRTERLRRLLLWNKFGLAGPVVLATLFLVVGFVSLMVLFPAPERHAATPDPLATPVRAEGQEGGLVPDVAITPEHGRTHSLRSYRPSVVILLPAGCGCAGRVQTVARAAGRHRVLTVLVSSHTPAPVPGLSDTDVVRGSDSTGTLATRFHLADKPVLLLVRADGVINRILVDVPSENALDGELVVIGDREPPR